MPRLSALEQSPTTNIKNLAVESPEKSQDMSLGSIVTPRLTEKIIETIDARKDNIDFFLRASSQLSLISQITGHFNNTPKLRFAEIRTFFEQQVKRVPLDSKSTLKHLAHARQVYGMVVESLDVDVYERMFMSGQRLDKAFILGSLGDDDDIRAVTHFYRAYPEKYESTVIPREIIQRMIKRAGELDGTLRLGYLALIRILHPDAYIEEGEIKEHLHFYRSIKEIQINPHYFLDELESLAILLAQKVELTRHGMQLVPPMMVESVTSSEKSEPPPLQRSF